MIKKKGILIASVFLLIGISMVIAYASFNSNVYDSGSTESTQNNKKIFSDVDESDWFYADVNYVNEHDLMKGTGENNFSPYEETTRGMIVTILWRLEGEPLEEGTLFEDVGTDAYYHAAIQWASNHQIVSGYSESIFGPDDETTREQMITIMYRYAAYKNYDTTKKAALDGYADRDTISEFAVDAIMWGYGNNIIEGTSSTTLSPTDTVQRCQVAAIIHRFCSQFIQASDITPEEFNSINDSMANTITTGNNHEQNNQDHGQSGGGFSSNSDSDSETNKTDETTEESAGSSESNIVGDYARLVVRGSEATAGDNTQISVVIENNPGILGMTLIAYYDESYCSLESVSQGDVFDGVLDLTTSKALNSGVKFMWDGIDISDEQVKDGTAILMNFQISENAPEGKIPITIKCYDGDVVDRDLKSIPLQIENGYISVK